MQLAGLLHKVAKSDLEPLAALPRLPVYVVLGRDLGFESDRKAQLSHVPDLG